MRILIAAAAVCVTALGLLALDTLPFPSNPHASVATTHNAGAIPALKSHGKTGACATQVVPCTEM